MPEQASWTQAWRRAVDRHPMAALCILPALAAAAFYAAPPVRPLLTTDSPGYLYFTAGRPAGYPAFLWLVHGAAGYSAVRTAQAALYCAAAVFCGVAARKFAGRLAAALGLQALLLAYPAPLQLADQIMADSLSATLTLLFAGQAMRIAVSPSLRNCGVAAALAGLGVLLRPDNIALFPAALLLCSCAEAVRTRAALVTLAWLGTALAITPLAHIALHEPIAGDHRLGREVMQKALFLPDSAGPPDDRCDTAYIDRAAAPLVAYWRAAPPGLQDVLRLRISNLLRYDVIIPGLVARHGFASVSETGPLLMCYTLTKARAAPLATAAAHEYRNLLLNYTFVGAAWQRGYAAFLQAHPPPLPARQPLPPATLSLRQRAAADVGQANTKQDDSETSLAPPSVRNQAAVWLLDTIQVSGCAASWIFMLAAAAMFARRGLISRRIVAAAALGLALQLHLLAIAAIEIAEPRYMFPLWSLFLVLLFLALVPRTDGAIYAAR